MTERIVNGSFQNYTLLENGADPTLLSWSFHGQGFLHTYGGSPVVIIHAGYIYQLCDLTNTPYLYVNITGYGYVNFSLNGGPPLNDIRIPLSQPGINTIPIPQVFQTANVAVFIGQEQSNNNLYIYSISTDHGTPPPPEQKYTITLKNTSGCYYITSLGDVQPNIRTYEITAGSNFTIYFSAKPAYYNRDFRINGETTNYEVLNAETGRYIINNISRDMIIELFACPQSDTMHSAIEYEQAGSTIQFYQIHKFGSGDYPVSYYWTFGDGSNSTEEHPLHTYTIPGNYEVSVRTYNNSTGCYYTRPVVIP